jgi:hypothetical protein
LNIATRERRVTAGRRLQKPVAENDVFWSDEQHQTWVDEEDDSSVSFASSVSVSDESIADSEDVRTETSDEEEEETDEPKVKKSKIYQSKKNLPPFVADYGLSQEELLAEAAVTEYWNKQTLANFEASEEAERKTQIQAAKRRPREIRKLDEQGNRMQLLFLAPEEKLTIPDERREGRARNFRYTCPVTGKGFNTVEEFREIRKALVQEESEDFARAAALLVGK